MLCLQWGCLPASPRLEALQEIEKLPSKSALFPKRPLNKDDLRLCLSTWAEQPQLSLAATAKHLELSQQRVSNAQHWAELGSLLNSQGLTSIGKLALEKDPYLESTVTDWIIHLHICLHNSRLDHDDSSIWSYLVHDFLRFNPKFDKSTLTQAISSKLPNQKANEIGNTFLKTYLQKESLAGCAFLAEDEDNYIVGNPNLKNAYTVGYLLSVVWQRYFDNQDCVLVSDIINTSSGLSTTLGIDEHQLREQLDRLAKIEVIEQRSAKPRSVGQTPERRQDNEASYLVVRCWNDPLDLLTKAYEEDPAIPNRPLAKVLGEILEEDDELPFFLSFSQNILSTFCPQQLQLVIESPSFHPPLHLAS